MDGVYVFLGGDVPVVGIDAVVEDTTYSLTTKPFLVWPLGVDGSATSIEFKVVSKDCVIFADVNLGAAFVFQVLVSCFGRCQC